MQKAPPKSCYAELPLISYKKDSGNEVFVTSLDSGSLSIYPMAEWEKIMTTLGKKSEDSNLRKFAILAARWGKRKRMDKRGRILIDKELRDKVNLHGKVIVEGKKNHLRLKNLSL